MNLDLNNLPIFAANWEAMRRMNMLKKNLLFVIICFTATLQAQNISVSLNWNGIINETFGSDTVQLLNFDNAEYGTVYGDFPTYIYQKNLGAISPGSIDFNVSISDVKTQAFSSDGKSIPGMEMPGENVKFEYYISQSRGESILEVHVLPAIKGNGGNLSLVTDFKINMQSVSMLKSKSSEVIDRFAKTSVLNSGKWVKIAVKESGLYKLTYADITDMGLDAKNVRVFGNGGNMLDIKFTNRAHDDLVENAVYLVSSDGNFKAGDYILFYAQGPNKWSYEYSTTNGDYQFSHKQHQFDDKAYYFLTSDAGTGKRVTIKPEETGIVNQNVTAFDDFKFVEPEEKNLLQSGSLWLSQDYQVNESTNYTFDFPNIITSEPTWVEMNVVSRTISSNGTFQLTYNNATIADLTLGTSTSNTTGQFAKMGSTVAEFTPNADNLQLNLKYVSAESNGTGWLDYIRIAARRQLKMTDSQMAFRDHKSMGIDNVAQYTISGAESGLKVLDVTDWVNPVEMDGTLSGTNYSFSATADQLKEYIAFYPNGSFSKPEVIGNVSNQNLHGTTAVDYIIFTHPDFKNQAERLANLHRAKGLSVIVVEPEQLYNEYSSGSRDITAFRWFAKMFYDRYTGSNNLKYVLFFGDATYDARPSTRNSSNNPNYLMTYESENSLHQSDTYASDDYFGFLDDSEGSAGTTDRVDIGIGRFPVSSVQQATQVVDKIEFYMTNKNRTPWKNTVLFIGDDEDGNIHARDANNLGDKVMDSNPELVVKKILIDAYQQVTLSSGPSYPDVNTLIDKNIEDGVLLLNYSGHGGETNLADEKIITTPRITNYSNLNNLPLWVTATCEFSRYDLTDETTAGEKVFLNPKGGGIGLFTTTRLVYSSANFVINYKFFDYVFKVAANGQRNRLGDVFRLTKKATGTGVNKRKFSLLGDPALELVYPTYKVVTSEINGKPVDEAIDTLKALSEITVSGYIENFTGSVASDFNGLLYPTVYDKILTKSTLANDYPEDKKEANKMDFKVWESILFSGKCEVKNGEFTFTFKVPKDINYTEGAGRISYYATSENNEAQGNFEDLIVGGYNDDHEADDVGPEVSIYLNTRDFKDGDRVNPSPLLIADVYDPSGINKAGSSIGHDIIAVLDNDPTTTVILNDNYESNLGDFTTGVLEYKFNNLTAGEHTLFFRIWDNHNNSSVQTITFYVENDIKPEIDDLLVYPNPVGENNDKVTFIFSHNRPGTVVDVVIEIFDTGGRRLAILKSPPISSPGNQISPIEWDLTTGSGVRVGKGMYLYRVSMTDSDTNNTSTGATKKLLVR